MAPTRVPESTFYRQELSRALTENAFAIDRSELLQPSSPSDDETFAAATVVLLEGTTITIECLNDGFRVRGRKDSKVYDTLDSLLLNESPKSMEKVSMQLTSKLESLITKEQDLQVSEDEGSAQHPGEGENTIQQPMPAVAKEAEEAQDSKTTPRVTQSSPHELLSSERQPTTNATLTIRCIKSFEYRTEKNLVLQHLDLTTLTVAQLIELCKDSEFGARFDFCPLSIFMLMNCVPYHSEIKTTAGFKPYRTVVFGEIASCPSLGYPEDAECEWIVQILSSCTLRLTLTR